MGRKGGGKAKRRRGSSRGAPAKNVMGSGGADGLRRASRYPELDLSRGFALVLMIVYHGFFVCDFIDLAKMDLYSGFFWLFARSIAASFLLIAGISLSVARSRLGTEIRGADLFRAFFLRGGKIFAAGLAITAITFFAVKSQRFVAFGILHLIGFCIIFAYPLARKPFLSLLLGALALALGLYLGSLRFDFPWLFWLGFRLKPEIYAPVDYVPLLPWASWFLFGIAAGNYIYPKGEPRRTFPWLGVSTLAKPLIFIGRHSLIVYLVHLPVIFGLLSLVKLLAGR